MNAVHVVDMGVVAALGQGVEAVWDGLSAGRTGLAPVRRFATDCYISNLAGCVPALDADAADVSQEVLRTVVRTIGRFDYDRCKGSFRSWLMSVARTRLCDFLANRGPQVCGSGETGVQRLLEEQSDAADEEEIWEQEYQRCLFDWAAEQIRDEFQDSTWQAFWQTNIEGKDTKHVARSLDMTVGAVYIARSRVLARLKKQIEQIEP